MEPATEQWAVKDKSRLLISIMEALAGDAHLSFEGDLVGLRLMENGGASDQETAVLKKEYALAATRLHRCASRRSVGPPPSNQ